MSELIFRPAVDQDVPRIADLEGARELRTMVGSWSREQHLKTLHDPDAAYWVVEDGTAKVIGFALLQGLRSEHHSIELKRIVVGVTDRGFGSRFLDVVASKVFNEYGAHRLWLDVFETNTRARHVYRTFGFREDGIFREAVYQDGAYHSLLLMTLLDREYRERQANLAVPG